jgi:ketosteroid isomerase-like protein
MASDRVERLRASLEEFDRTGLIPPDYFSPDFELHQSSSIVDTAGVFRGPGASQASIDELGGSFEDMTWEPERFFEAPGGEIVVFIHARARGRASGLELDNHIAWVWTFKDGKAVRMVVYEEPADALEAVGLPRSDASLP